MKTQYLSNNENTEEYTQMQSSLSQQNFVDKVKTLEWSLGYMQKVEKYLAVNELNDKTKPYYYLSIHIN